jgi:hypothetical protein
MAPAVVLAVAALTLAFGADVAAQPVSVVAPHQTFTGLVNGQRSDASVDVVCPGPVRLGQMGYPAGGQTVAVSLESPSSALAGNTGSRGRSIVARFVTPSTVAPPTVTFTQYGSQPIPTVEMLPCSGSGAVMFSPLPTSHTARSARVSVTYVPTCTNPCPVTDGTGPSSATATAVAAQSPSPHGVIAGQLGFEGGPYPGGFHPTAGVVKYAGPQTGRVKVPGSGDFTVDVAPGAYTLIGCGGTRNEQCGPTQDITVKAHKTSHVQVVWLLAP